MGLQTVRHDLVTEQQQQQQSWGVLVRSFVEWPSFRFIRCFLMIGLNLWVGGGKTSEVIYLAHWNWTKLGSDPPACSKANLTTPDCSEGNFSVCGKVPNAEPNKKNGQLMFKRPEDRNALQERVFKSKVKEQVTGWMISSCTSFSLAGGEASRWLFGGILIVNLLIPTSLGLPACGQHTVNFFHQLAVSISAVCAVLSHSVVSDFLGRHGL